MQLEVIEKDYISWIKFRNFQKRLPLLKKLEFQKNGRFSSLRFYANARCGKSDHYFYLWFLQYRLQWHKKSTDDLLFYLNNKYKKCTYKNTYEPSAQLSALCLSIISCWFNTSFDKKSHGEETGDVLLRSGVLSLTYPTAASNPILGRDAKIWMPRLALSKRCKDLAIKRATNR